MSHRAPDRSEARKDRRRVCAIAAISLIALSGACASRAETAPGQEPPRSRLSAAEVKTTLVLARAARSAGDLPAAIGFYQRIAGKSADPALRVELADTLLLNGRIDDAIGAYRAIPPTSRAGLAALLGLQRCYAQLRQPALALEYAQRAVGVAPRDEAARVDLGVALDALGRHAEAQAAYRLALLAMPMSIAARNDLALSLAMTGQFQEGVDILTPMANSSNASPRVRQNLALIYGLKGDHAKAVALGRADLAEADAEANARVFDLARGRSR